MPTPSLPVSGKTPSLDEIVLGDIHLRGHFVNDVNRVSYRLIIHGNSRVTPAYSGNFPESDGKVIAHLLRNPGIDVSKREILAISGWPNTERMDYLARIFYLCSADYKIVQIDSHYRLQEKKSDYARVPVNSTNLRTSTIQILLDYEEIMKIGQINNTQLDKILAREEAARFLVKRGGTARISLAPFVTFLNGQPEYKPAAERLYGLYLDRIKP